MHEAALDKLQALRDALGKPFIVRSAYRSPEHNKSVGGATRSKHMDGTAFDIAMSNHDPAAFEAAAREAGFFGFGSYSRSDFIHIDLGPTREWGKRFAPRPAFGRETPPARERLAENRRIIGAASRASRASARPASRSGGSPRCRGPCQRHPMRISPALLFRKSEHSERPGGHSRHEQP